MINAITREELYLAYLNGESNVIPKPILRKEQYLYQLCLKASGGGLTDEQLQNALGVYFENNPISTNQEFEWHKMIMHEYSNYDNNSILNWDILTNTTEVSGKNTSNIMDYIYACTTNAVNPKWTETIRINFIVDLITNVKELLNQGAIQLPLRFAWRQPNDYEKNFNNIRAYEVDETSANVWRIYILKDSLKKTDTYVTFSLDTNTITRDTTKPELFMTDTSLSKSGWSADAKAVGDALANIDVKFNSLLDEVAYYYDSLSSAITDVNNGVSDNSLIDIANGNVKVFKNHEGNTTVILLNDISESAEIVINKDIELVLKGHTLSFTASNACLNFGTDTDCTINGEGGSIVKTWEGDVTSSITFLKSVGKKLIIKGGTYSVEGNAVGIHGLNLASCLESEIDGINLIIKNNYTGATTGVRGMTPSSNKCKILNSTISCTSVYISVAVYNNKLNTYIENCTINSTAIANSSNYACGISVQNTATGIVHVKDSKLLADAPDCHVGTSNYSVAIRNENILYCDNVELNGTHSGISNHGDVYVNGGTYTGYCHGGIYFVQGEGHVAYVNDATIKSGNYEGVYDYTSGYKPDEIYGAFYVGGNANATGITVNLDGCTIEHPNVGYAFVVRGSDGESNNTVNISNSTIVNAYDSAIRIDNETLKINIGTGTNITESMIDNPSYAEFTEELYRMIPSDKKCDGNDYNALYQAIKQLIANS